MKIDLKTEKFVRFQAKDLLKKFKKDIEEDENNLIELIVTIEKEASIFRGKHRIAELNKN